jgi:asparagine synthase (glutamine-hydrolysing)
MCGICGKVMFGSGATVSPQLVREMADTIYHRGPDDEGYHVSGQVGLGFRRLSIIDLKSGHQPLSNEDGTVWIVFNGEIYNYRELRASLLARGHDFKTQTDTECIVHLYEEMGSQCLEKLRGMFAFAIWDQKAKTLFLARDRVGIKPLYYYLDNSALIFASEIKAILADPTVRREIDAANIDRFLTFHYLPGEDTLLKGVRKLAPGTCLSVRNGRPEFRQYWDLKFSKSTIEPGLERSERDLRDLLTESVELHMIADVPVGILLSGGVDSSGVLSLASGLTDKPTSSYTVGFSDSAVADERPFARLAASAYNSDHHEITISASDFADFLPQFVWHMEEPICEPPAIALYYVSKLARQFVTVLLSGEGGDEGFAGYSNYRNIVWLERFKRLLSPFNGAVGGVVSAVSSLLKVPRVGKYAPLMSATFPNYYYSRTSSPQQYSSSGIAALYSTDYSASLDGEQTVEPLRKLFANVKDECVLDQMLYIDTKTWLPDDLLVKADKMTMANSIELRVPLLDHRVLEFAASLPAEYKLRKFTTKYLLKRALGQSLPKEILNRKKAGFPVPYEGWLRNESRSLVHSILLDSKTLQRGYFERSSIERLLSANQEHGMYPKEVFSLVTLELWHRAFLDGQTAQLRQSAS